MKAPSYTAPLLLGADLMDHLCLHPAVREKGGAYGVGATYSPASGTFHFHSFRDPHLAPTIAAFQQALEQIGDGSFTSEDLEEAKLSAIQSLDAPVPPASRAMTGYGWLRTGRTLRARQQFRRELLDATADQVASAIRTHLTPAPKALAACTHRDILTHEPLSLTSPPTDII
jgi:Zn-dependent M16 (insulinase) family peptidase